MKHFTPEFPYWSRRSAELFVLTVAQNRTFSVSRDGDAWWLRIPNKGLRKCISMEVCEAIALHHVLNPEPDDDDETEDIGPSPEELLREHLARVL